MQETLVLETLYKRSLDSTTDLCAFLCVRLGCHSGFTHIYPFCVLFQHGLRGSIMSNII